MGNLNRKSENLSFSNCGYPVDCESIYASLDRMRICDQLKLQQNIKEGDVMSISNVFEVNGYSILQNVNSQDIGQYKNILHLAFELEKLSVIEYLIALGIAQSSLSFAMSIKNYCNQNIFDISIQKGKQLVQLLLTYPCHNYSKEFVQYSLDNDLREEKSSKQILSRSLLLKYGLKQEQITYITPFKDQDLDISEIRSKYTYFRNDKLSRILNMKIHQIKIYPDLFHPSQIWQSTFLNNCYLISIFKSVIMSGHYYLIRQMFNHSDSIEYLSFSAKYTLKMYENAEPLLISVDDYFLYSHKQSLAYTSPISLDSVYFNFIEKAWIKRLGGYHYSQAYSVDYALLNLFNIPVYSLILSSIQFHFFIMILKEKNNFTIYFNHILLCYSFKFDSF